MAKFVLKEDFLELFPEVEIGIIVAKNINNDPADLDEDQTDSISELLNEGFQNAASYITADVFSENKVIAVWREAYRRFKTKKGARSSIEAMLKRVQKGNTPGSINPLVDIYNAASLSYALPCGGEDIDSFAGDLLLTIAEGGDHDN